VRATQTLAQMPFQRGALADAEHHTRNAVRLSPTDPRSRNLMGMIITEADRPQIDAYRYRRVRMRFVRAKRASQRSCQS
jgi:Flp pilus assembly protein TadD